MNTRLNTEIPRANFFSQWTFWIIQQTSDSPPIPHPIHLHGHDFFILGAQEGAIFDTTTSVTTLNFNNPPRRDVAMLPQRGYLVIAFPTDNPGAWLMHCHIVSSSPEFYYPIVIYSLALILYFRRFRLFTSLKVWACSFWRAWTVYPPLQPTTTAFALTGKPTTMTILPTKRMTLGCREGVEIEPTFCSGLCLIEQEGWLPRTIIFSRGTSHFMGVTTRKIIKLFTLWKAQDFW